MAQQTHIREIRHAHLYCGLGGGARGFNRGRARVGATEARFRCVGGIDSDPAAIRDFQRMAGVPGTLLDLFSYEQYVAFHGREPPPGWREATIADLHRAFGYERPHILFLSAPCKGFSGLLAEKQARTEKYQALNGLTLRGMLLALEAYRDDPPELILFENVPRIASRGRYLIDQIAGLLRGYGYAIAETAHDCGELGGLAQSRQRFLLVARHMEKVPPLLYQPPKRRLRGVGEVLDRMPLPGDIDRGGPMHRVPALQWQTWVRLAFVEAGKDWRSLNQLRVEDGVLKDFAIAPAGDWHNGALGVSAWDESAGVVTSNGRPASGAFSVADPRSELWGAGQAGVTAWQEHACTVRSARSPLQNRGAVADPRVDGHDKSVQLGVRPWNRPAGVITGKMFAGGGPNSVADPRLSDKPRFSNVYRIVPWTDQSPAVTSAHGSLAAIADPRGAENRHVNGKYRITGYDQAANAVIAASTTGNGACAVADPRVDRRSGAFGVLAFEQPAGVVAGESLPPNGAFAVADPRTGLGPDSHRNKLKVVDYQGRSSTVTGSDRVGSGALSVADPRPRALAPDRPAYRTQGHYGVVPWQASAGAVTGWGQVDNGRWAVADRRLDLLPGRAAQLVCIIIARDGTWHRPFTTLELAALQSLYDLDDFLELEGRSDAAWRERIGNAVPSDAAQAMADVFGDCLLRAWAGESFSLSTEAIWVRQLQIALSVDTHGQVTA